MKPSENSPNFRLRNSIDELDKAKNGIRELENVVENLKQQLYESRKKCEKLLNENQLKRDNMNAIKKLNFQLKA